MSNLGTTSELLAIVNHHLNDKKGETSTAATIFIEGLDGSLGFALHGNLFKYLYYLVTTPILNLAKWLKSLYTRRTPNLISIKKRNLPIQAQLQINRRNGTIVVIADRTVHKFFFKDQTYFSYLYSSLLNLNHVEMLESCFVIQQKRFDHLEPAKQNLFLIERELELLQADPDSLTRQREYLSPTYKAKQLFNFYGCQTEKLLELSTKAADKIILRASSFSQRLCHGDLWHENIMVDAHGEVKLIDFDKALFFLPAYDYIYYFLMNELSLQKTNLDLMLEETERTCSDVTSFLEPLDFLGDVSKDEVRISIMLFLLLKLSEREFRNGGSGECLVKINKHLNELYNQN